MTQKRLEERLTRGPNDRIPISSVSSSGTPAKQATDIEALRKKYAIQFAPETMPRIGYGYIGLTSSENMYALAKDLATLGMQSMLFVKRNGVIDAYAKKSKDSEIPKDTVYRSDIPVNQLESTLKQHADLLNMHFSEVYLVQKQQKTSPTTFSLYGKLV